MSTTAARVTARCVHCMWRTDQDDPAMLREVRDIHELVHPGGTVLVRLADEIMADVEEVLADAPAPGNGKRQKGYWTRELCIEAIRAFHAEHGRTPRQPELRAPLPASQILARLFGSMGEAIAAAGFEPRARGGSRTRAEAMPPPEAPTKRRSPGRKQAAKDPEPAPVKAVEETLNGLVDLARAVEDADTEWGEAITVMEAAQERYEAAKTRLAEAVRVLADRVEAA